MRHFALGIVISLAILVSGWESLPSEPAGASECTWLPWSALGVANENYLPVRMLPATVTRSAPTPRPEGATMATIKGLYPEQDIIDTQGVQQGSGEGAAGSGRGIKAIIREAAEEHGVPVGLMLALAREENRQLDPEAIYETPRERSIGIYQMNVKGGMGIGHAEEALMDPEYNADLAAQTIRREYERTGTWRGALWPWRGTRDAALAKWREE